MDRYIKVSELDDAICDELSLYHEDVTKKINDVGASAMKKLVMLTRQNAPSNTGAFKKSLTSKELIGSNSSKSYVLYARAPNYRIFHLLVHGHAKQNGGRVQGDPFLQKALDIVLPQYEKEVREALE